ncbi:hypothetical protein M3Y97_00695700 [Aphelenchoides bicaudatus]|nr:hypothetical protein M3Y97_00695700 [Aphelenchoides bicaudatus]
MSNAKRQSKAITDEDKSRMREMIVGIYGEDEFNKTRSEQKAFGLGVFYRSNTKISKIYQKIYSSAFAHAYNWSPLIKFYQVNCVNENNTELCKKYGVRIVPVFKFFKPQSDDLGESIKAYTNATYLLTDVVKRINKYYNEGQCENCPNLELLPDNVTTVDDLWNMPTHFCSQEIHLVVTESENDLYGITDFLEERKQNPHGYPVLRALRTHPLVKKSSGQTRCTLIYRMKGSADDCRRNPRPKKFRQTELDELNSDELLLEGGSMGKWSGFRNYRLSLNSLETSGSLKSEDKTQTDGPGKGQNDTFDNLASDGKPIEFLEHNLRILKMLEKAYLSELDTKNETVGVPISISGGETGTLSNGNDGENLEGSGEKGENFKLSNSTEDANLEASDDHEHVTLQISHNVDIDFEALSSHGEQLYLNTLENTDT